MLKDLEVKEQQYKDNSNFFSSLIQTGGVIQPLDAEITKFTDLLYKSPSNATESKERLLLSI